MESKLARLFFSDSEREIVECRSERLLTGRCRSVKEEAPGRDSANIFQIKWASPFSSLHLPSIDSIIMIGHRRFYPVKEQIP